MATQKIEIDFIKELTVTFTLDGLSAMRLFHYLETTDSSDIDDDAVRREILKYASMLDRIASDL